MIQFENLSKTFKNGVVGVRQASGSFDDSGIHLIMGHFGSDQTTLLQMIALLQQPTQGTIRKTFIVSPERGDFFYVPKETVHQLSA